MPSLSADNWTFNSLHSHPQASKKMAPKFDLSKRGTEAKILCTKCEARFFTKAGYANHRCKKGLCTSRGKIIQFLFSGAPRYYKGKVSTPTGATTKGEEKRKADDRLLGVCRPVGRPRKAQSPQLRASLKAARNRRAYCAARS